MQRRQFLIDKMIENKKKSDAQDSMIDKLILDKKKNDINDLAAAVDNVYFNVSIVNPIDNDSQLATYQTQFFQPLLKNPSDYWVSVIRFTVPLQELPFFIWPTNGGVPSQDIDYSITITYKNVDYLAYLTYVPYYTSWATPVQPVASYVFNYQQLFDSMNAAYEFAFNALYLTLSTYNSLSVYASGDMVTDSNISYISLQNTNTGNTPASSPLYWAPVYAPYVTFDQNNKLIQINVSTGWKFFSGVNPIDQPLKLWMNSNLFNRFTNFNVIINGVGPLYLPNNSNGKNFLHVVNNLGNNMINLDKYGSGISGYALKQEFPALYNLDDFRKIVITSSSLKIRNESTKSKYSVTDDDISLYYPNNNTVSEAKVPILTDFEIDLVDGPEVRSYAYYVPTAEYRLIDLLGNDPLVSLDLSIYWQDKIGNIYPLYIPPKNSADVKLLFRRRKIFS